MNTTERHLTDAELLRLIDDEDLGTAADRPADPDRAGAAGAADADPGRTNGQSRAHAERCDQCAEALATLQGESARITDWLERAAFEAPGPGHYGLDATALHTPAPDPTAAGPAGTPRAQPVPGDATAVRRIGSSPRSGTRAVPPPAGPGVRSFLKAAAIILLLAAPLAAFPGVRAWVADRIAPADEIAMTSAEPEAVILRFVPTPGGFQVSFPTGTTGLLSLKRSDGQEAEFRAEGGAPETVVTASSLEIRNDDAGRYELRLPRGVAGVWVRVGDRAVAVTGSQVDRGTVVELGR